MPDKKLPAVPETILKRRKRQASARAERAKAIVAAKKVCIPSNLNILSYGKSSWQENASKNC